MTDICKGSSRQFVPDGEPGRTAVVYRYESDDASARLTGVWIVMGDAPGNARPRREPGAKWDHCLDPARIRVGPALTWGRPKSISSPMDHARYSDDYIAGILGEVKVFAFVGASANTNRPSTFAMKYLIGKGFTVIPVNPGLAGQQILGQTVHARLADVPAPVDAVDIFRNTEAALEVTREAIALKDKLGLKFVWMQLGVRNEQAAAEAEAAGLKVVMNRCPKIEYGRLSGEIGWAGVNSGMISSVRPRLGAAGFQNHVLGPPGKK